MPCSLTDEYSFGRTYTLEMEAPVLVMKCQKLIQMIIFYITILVLVSKLQGFASQKTVNLKLNNSYLSDLMYFSSKKHDFSGCT